MSTPSVSLQNFAPMVDRVADPHTRILLQLLFRTAANHGQGFQLLTDKVNKLQPGSSTTKTIVEGGGGGSTPSQTTGIAVNDQSGVTSYTTQNGDNGTLIIFSDASPIAVTLASQSTPWGCFISNLGSLGAGTVTLTPGTGTINGGATLSIPPTYWAIVAFDGTNWFAATLPIVPETFSAGAHQFLTGYDGSTGAFAAAQPAYSDLTGTPMLPSDAPATASKWVNSYTASTGAFTETQPAFTDISGQLDPSQLPSSGLSVTIITAALTSGGMQGSMTFTNGILTSQTPAT